MLRALSNLFESLSPARAPADTAAREHALQLATAVLLIEVMRADGEVSEEEERSVLQALRSRFTLTDRELADLVELAHDRSENTHDLFSFTSKLNEALDAAEKAHVFELLWTVAWADGRADAHEEHLLRRVADLLHLRYADAIGAKLRAEAAAREAAKKT
ncbi:MAG: TerB family tellurite resistance protein [Pseudomonadota bacterium]|jgi:uncharacterized tellurite resistance protein B-like protein|nr:MAG: hypothetical protein DIU62_02585 [Pseudomonadota bacterium]